MHGGVTEDGTSKPDGWFDPLEEQDMTEDDIKVLYLLAFLLSRCRYHGQFPLSGERGHYSVVRAISRSLGNKPETKFCELSATLLKKRGFSLDEWVEKEYGLTITEEDCCALLRFDPGALSNELDQNTNSSNEPPSMTLTEIELPLMDVDQHVLSETSSANPGTIEGERFIDVVPGDGAMEEDMVSASESDSHQTYDV